MSALVLSNRLPVAVIEEQFPFSLLNPTAKHF